MRDLALLCSVSLLGGTNLLFSTTPALVSGGDQIVFSLWASNIGALLGAAAMLVSSFLPHRQVDNPRLAAGQAIRLVVILLATIAVSVALLELRVVDLAGSGWEAGRHPVLLTVQLVGAACFALAAVGFLRRALGDVEEFLRWLEIGAILAAFGRLNYFLDSRVDPQWVSMGDLLRLAFYVLLAAGAAREIRAYWHQLSVTAALEERRRMARELHDGLAQELAYITRQARRLSHLEQDYPSVARLVAASDRALEESRRAIGMLTQQLDVPLDIALRGEIDEVSDRYPVTVGIHVSGDLRIPPWLRDAVLRITREAVTNAARHGNARLITVGLTQTKRFLSLRVEDNGVGFDPQKTVLENGHFGLVGMMERAESLGGEFNVTSQPGRGTTIEVKLPWPTTSEGSLQRTIPRPAPTFENP